MERKISLDDIRKTVDEAYENFKSVKEGSIDSRLKDVDPEKFGISVVLTDGTVINKGDAQEKAAIGNISKLAIASVLLAQNTPDELVKKSGSAECCCHGKQKPDIPFSAHGIRAVSAVAPQNDPEGKYDILLNRLIDMAGDAPEFDDNLYKTLSAQAKEADVENKIAQAQYDLYDNTAVALEVYLKLNSLKMSAQQLATMGATIAADGVNVINNNVVFDGSIAANIVTLAAIHGKKKAIRGWLMSVGLPAKGSFAGALVAILPGFGAIAAYSPELNCYGRSARGSEAIKYIANKLQLNVFASARVSVEK
ncbi:MAG: glutaminase [Muribaculaceae bacterium]|nr:glutaminase [Muribaculaceae bacterium]